uniref:Uncharacterized protein n=1 Tax=Rhodosorus marinus TaxID=101924 RepID=A0A7S2ZZU0_9RHOD|mmetsp:Transcript_3770/g.16407  ORF Transcript_3770/g.16407 Transcript_3770/m.16407 type:complete len:130 (+) Transcript_3770:450-839(+)
MEEKIRYQSGGRRIVCTARRIKDTVAALFILQDLSSSLTTLQSMSDLMGIQRSIDEKLRKHFSRHTLVYYSVLSQKQTMLTKTPYNKSANAQQSYAAAPLAGFAAAVPVRKPFLKRLSMCFMWRMRPVP